MINGVTFAGGNTSMHSYDDWGLLLSSVDIGIPSIKTEYVDIIGGSGTIDLTEVYGEVFYDDRNITMNFTALDDKLRWTDKLDIITAYLHGKTFKITFDNNKAWYFIGRVSLDKYTSSKRLAKIVLKAVCEPYKLKQDKTIVKRQISGKTNIKCVCARMETIPTFTVSSPMTMKFNNSTYSLSNTVKYSDIVFVQGDNDLEFDGSGQVTITYQEGTI
ncbi:MAG: hypothetical protein Q4C64_02355 [Erysipelotrichia bacterium]|nr:hypothetical protein [Erysipelotrichia bacterium]